MRGRAVQYAIDDHLDDCLGLISSEEKERLGKILEESESCGMRATGRFTEEGRDSRLRIRSTRVLFYTPKAGGDERVYGDGKARIGTVVIKRLEGDWWSETDLQVIEGWEMRGSNGKHEHRWF
jgi:hypothetical protein